MEERDKTYNIYNIYAEKVVLLDVNDRKYVVKGLGQSNIWYGNEEEDRKVETIIENYEKDKINKVTEIEKYTEELEGKEKEAVVKVRINQDKFREKLINKYKKCCLCNVNMNELLVASHIKPWSVSNIKTERTNPSNGLCLNAMHDKAFDRGLITIDKNYRIENSRYIKDAVMDEKTREWFAFYNGKEIILPDKFLPGKEFIQYHNDVIFKGV